MCLRLPKLVAVALPRSWPGVRLCLVLQAALLPVPLVLWVVLARVLRARLAQQGRLAARGWQVQR